ncbi:MAG: electron transport complex subunit RsxC, partial [Gammaproteobacteria bacterium]
MITVLEKPAPFGGGVALPPNKSMSLQVPLSDAAIPALLTLPLRQHIGIAAEPLVKPGDHVLTGQVIARSRGVVSAPLHASASGVVKEIADYELPSPSRVVAPSIVIETDGEDNWIETEADNLVDYLNTSPVAIQQRILQSGIVGLGGAGFPSAVKLIPGLS